MSFIIKLLVSGLAVFLTAMILPGVAVASYWQALILAVILAILNAVVKPVLVVLTIPLTIVSLGLFLLVINALIVLLADWFVTGFYVANFGWAILFAIILSVITSVLDWLIKDDNKKR